MAATETTYQDSSLFEFTLFIMAVSEAFQKENEEINQVVDLP